MSTTSNNAASAKTATNEDRSASFPPEFDVYVARTQSWLDLLALSTIWLVLSIFTGQKQIGLIPIWLACRVAISAIYLVDLIIRRIQVPAFSPRPTGRSDISAGKNFREHAPSSEALQPRKPRVVHERGIDLDVECSSSGLGVRVASPWFEYLDARQRAVVVGRHGDHCGLRRLHPGHSWRSPDCSRIAASWPCVARRPHCSDRIKFP